MPVQNKDKEKSLRSADVILSTVPVQEDGHKVIDIQTPNASPSTQSVGSANSSGGAADLYSNSPIVPVNNQ